MARRPDKLVPFDDILAAHDLEDPWQHERGETPVFAPDWDLLASLLTVPIGRGEASQSGLFAKGVDAWVAHELRRAGFGDDEIWPRATPPRVLPRDVAALLDKLPASVSDDLRPLVADIASVTPADAVILGRAYSKQVDVLLSRWDRGPELIISTKTQVSSFGNNLNNRFEEAWGDAANLSARYPMAAVGFIMVQRATIRDQYRAQFENSIDMIRKLRSQGGGEGYTASALVLVDWDDDERIVRVDDDDLPDDVAMPQFLVSMIDKVLTSSSVTHHVRVRELIERRNLAVPELDTIRQDDAVEGGFVDAD